MGTKAPSKCPACGSISDWVCTGESKKGISAGKAVGGAVIAGPVGAVVGGALGKKKYTYYCRSCNFREDYDEKATPPSIPAADYAKKGYDNNNFNNSPFSAAEQKKAAQDNSDVGCILTAIAVVFLLIVLFASLGGCH